jgi:hypothetical protein
MADTKMPPEAVSAMYAFAHDSSAPGVATWAWKAGYDFARAALAAPEPQDVEEAREALFRRMSALYRGDGLRAAIEEGPYTDILVDDFERAIRADERRRLALSPDFEEFMRLAHEVWPFTGTPADRLRADAFTAARSAFEDSVGWSYTAPSEFQLALAQTVEVPDAE